MQWPLPNPKPSWSRLRIVLISSILLLLVVSSLAWRQPSDAYSSIKPTATAMAPNLVEKEAAEPGPASTAIPHANLAPTLLPPEYLTNSQQTTGIILIGSIMVLIVVAGVLRTLLSERRSL